MATHLNPPQNDPFWVGEVLLTDDTHRYLWVWYGFNLRLLAVSHAHPDSYTHAWCYPRDPNALRTHVTAWDPDTRDEPTGWHKRAPTGTPRRAPRRDPDDPLNGVRCEHGAYLGSACHTTVCRDMLRLENLHHLPSAQPIRNRP